MTHSENVSRVELEQYCDQFLQVTRFRDYCPNGLQVEGREKIKRIVSGVTACQALIDQAVALDADLILVHHGYFWKGEDAAIQGIKKRRLQTLLAHDINLMAFHLPLDAHAEVGNNAQLAQKLGIQVTGGLEPNNPLSIGNVGELAQAQTLEQFAALIEQQLAR